jgi:hypothetical protein
VEWLEWRTLAGFGDDDGYSSSSLIRLIRRQRSVLLYLSWETIEEKNLQLGAFSGQVALDGRIRSSVCVIFIFTNIYLLEMVLHIRCAVDAVSILWQQLRLPI